MTKQHNGIQPDYFIFRFYLNEIAQVLQFVQLENFRKLLGPQPRKSDFKVCWSRATYFYISNKLVHVWRSSSRFLCPFLINSAYKTPS